MSVISLLENIYWKKNENIYLLIVMCIFLINVKFMLGLINSSCILNPKNYILEIYNKSILFLFCVCVYVCVCVCAFITHIKQTN